MAELDDHRLLAQFARENSETAFAALVQRHVNLVYSAARRHAGNDHAAQEITQAVFIILAQKAGQISSKTILSCWLYQTARLTAANFLRGEIRRQKREQEAYMQSTLNQTEAEAWPQIAPLLDDALARLGERDRNAIVLRFFENKSLREVGHALGAGEDAAKMRVNRALEKLRKFFSKGGVTFSATVIASAVAANSIQAAPAGLAQTATTVALDKGAAAGGSTLALVKGTLKAIAWTKAKTLIAVGAGILFVAGTASTLVEQSRTSSTNDSWRSLIHFYSQTAMLADLNNTPPQVTILPTIHPDWGAMWWADKSGRRLGINSSVTNLLMYAYGERTTRMTFSEPTAGGKYDFIVNLPQGSEAAFRQKIREQFGVVAHKSVIPATVWVLTVSDPEKIKTRLSQRTRAVREDGAWGEWKMKGATVANLADALEGLWLFAPVIDRTGLLQRYDFSLAWDVHDKSKRIPMITNELKQFGLELAPTNMSVEMLVVEKTKD